MCVLCIQVNQIHKAVEALPDTIVLKEDARKISRLSRRVEVLLTDLQPYVGPAPPPQFQAVLQVRSREPPDSYSLRISWHTMLVVRVHARTGCRQSLVRHARHHQPNCHERPDGIIFEWR